MASISRCDFIVMKMPLFIQPMQQVMLVRNARVSENACVETQQNIL